MKTSRTRVNTACLGIFVCWSLASVVWAQGKYVPGELLVKFRPGISTPQVTSLNQEVGCEAIRRIGFIDVHHLKITSGLTVAEAVARYSRNPNVEFAEPNYRIELLQRTTNNAERWPNDDTFDPAEPEYGWQWSLDNWGQTGGTVDADIDAPQMWRMITDADPDIIVAIMDTGIDMGHPDLAANIWTNPDEIPGNGVDDDNNNYIDDLNGYDFVNGDNDPTDDDGHGTHVAGIVGAVGNNGIGSAGIAWNVQLMPIKIIEPSVLNDHAANVVLGIDYAMHEDAKIINMSFRLVEYSRAVELAIDRANGAGILVVAAAGNDASDNDVVPLYPASYPHDNIIAVAASDHNDELWFWGLGSGSNWGRASVDLAAPGEEIYSTTPTYPVPDWGLNYDWATGTSMAAPHVSGVAALCWSLDPWLTHLQLKDVLLNDPFSFNAADKEKKPAFRHGGVGEVLTEGRLRAAQNGDFGDAPDEPYPTHWPPLGWGAIHLDCGLEWLGYDVSLERSAVDFVTDTDGVPNLNPADNDGFDDGVTFFPPYFCKGPGAFDRVDAEVTVSDPVSGRYDNGRYLYLTCFFDFNDSGDWWDVSKCVLPGDAPEHLLIQAVGGPGAASVVNPLPDNKVVIDPSLWAGPATRQSRRFELYFYSPPEEEVAETIWTRFRLEYDDQVWPSPDNKFLGMEFDYSLFGEVEDYFVENPTTGRLVIEDFESYTGTVGGANPLVGTWIPAGGATEWLDPLVWHGGAQSMGIGYTNNTPPFSVSFSESTRTFASPHDFTAGGVKSLSIWFKGLAANAAERMYLIVEDNTATSAETAHSNPLAVLDPSWQEWNIDLGAFGVDLTSIQKITIGLGNRSAAGPPASGTVWFDDFALYPPRCFPQHGPLADLTGDCIVDYRDLRIVAEDWLRTDALLVVQEPCDANLVGWWELDGDASDSSANGHHGTAQGQYGWVGGRIGPGAIEFSGTGGRVLVPDHPQLRPTDQVSASAWVYYSVNQHLPARVVVKGADNTETFIVLIDNLDEFMFHVRDPNGAMCGVAAGPLDKDEWVHLAGTYNGLLVTGYVDGRQVGSWYEPGIPLSQDSNGLAIGNRSDAMNREFIGKVDDVRVYNYGLSGAEVGWLASEGAGYIPLVSLANIYDEEPLGEKAVNLRDYAVLVDQWLIQILWP